MLERVIIRLLKKGIQDLIDDPRRLELHFTLNEYLTAAEAAVIRTKFLAEPPSVIFQYPRADSKFPLYAVVLAGEKEVEPRFLGDFGGFTGSTMPSTVGQIPTIGTGTIVKSSLYDAQYEIRTYSNHPDVTLYYYELAKYILTRERDALKECGVLHSAFSGQDMAPDTSYSPEWLFRRKLVVMLRREQQVIDDRYQGINEIRGPHVRDDNPDHEFVDAHVVPYVEEVNTRVILVNDD